MALILESAGAGWLKSVSIQKWWISAQAKAAAIS
jgi:hypothetical protein